MRTESKWAQLLLIFSLLKQRQRVLLLSAAVLMWIGGVACCPEAIRSSNSAFAQAPVPSPPSDTPVMRPGQRLGREYGWAEIETFTRSESGKGEMFTVTIRIWNGSSNQINFEPDGSSRLITDGFPAAPIKSSPSYVSAPSETMGRFSVTFQTNEHPKLVFFQFGTGNGRTFLRWPDN